MGDWLGRRGQLLSALVAGSLRVPFKQAHFWFRLTAFGSACSVRVIEAGSLFRFLPTTRVALLILFVDRLNDKVNIGRAFVAGSLFDQSGLINLGSVRACNARTRRACSDRVYRIR